MECGDRRVDVDNLKEEALVALSDAALRLACVAKAQSTRRRHIASRRAQIEDWEARHAQAIAGVETVHHALAALRKRIDQDGMEGEDAATALNLVEHWLSVDVRYQAKHKELKHAVSDADFESVRALNDTLESLAAERSQAGAAVDGALAKPRPDVSTPDEPEADGAKSSEPGDDRNSGQCRRTQAVDRPKRSQHVGPKRNRYGINYGGRPSNCRRGQG